MKFLDIRSFVYGGTASVFAEFGTFPLDTTKTRLMVQGQRQTTNEIIACRYKGMSHVFYKICTEEGYKALFKGLSVALIRQASYGTLKIGIYESLKPHAAAALPLLARRDTMVNNVLCAAVAGTVSSCVATPTDVVKVRLQASGLCPSNQYSGSLIAIFRSIYQEEGLRGLWRGVGPTAQRATLVSSVQLPTYEASKRFLLEQGLLGDNAASHFVSSICAGVASAAACNPVDVIKSRMMNQHCNSSATQPGLYTSSWDCALQTCRAEGLRALWKGLVPNCMRMGPWNIVFFLTLERLKSLDARVSRLEASDIESVLGKSQEIAAVSLEIVDGEVCLKDLRAN